MGMSHDYAVAVEEGATIVRVGTALFGARPGAGGDASAVPSAGGPMEDRTAAGGAGA
jgi:hypothetical protein